jgi:rubrerythrin
MKLSGVSEQIRVFNTDYEFNRSSRCLISKLRVLQEGVLIVSTNDNLKEAFAGESQANRKYLAFAKNALAVEEIHHGLYSKALKAVKSGSDLPETKIFVCSVCSNTVEDSAPDKCPVCGASRKQFNETL